MNVVVVVVDDDDDGGEKDDETLQESFGNAEMVMKKTTIDQKLMNHFWKRRGRNVAFTDTTDWLHRLDLKHDYSISVDLCRYSYYRTRW